MKDVFLSYSSKDRPKAALIERALEGAGFSVFWDQEIPPGRDWDSWIREHLNGAKVAIVLWSKTSVASANVKHEAMIAKENSKLIPALIEPLTPSDFPMGMYLTQAVLLADYRGGEHAGMAKLISEVSARIGRAATPGTAPRKGLPPAAVALGLVAAAALASALVWGGANMLPKPTQIAAAPTPAAPESPATLDPNEEARRRVVETIALEETIAQEETRRKAALEEARQLAADKAALEAKLKAATNGAGAAAPTNRMIFALTPEIGSQFHEALMSLDAPTIRQMLDAGYNPNWTPGKEKNAALHDVMMVCERYPNHNHDSLTIVVRMLINAGGNVRAANIYGDTPLTIASSPRYCGPTHPVIALLR